ncbi:MAG TPA: MFS transporter [Kineosporiaceae bacterium]|nr:MFS transporter [Kineosporiaceae bacterium]
MSSAEPVSESGLAASGSTVDRRLAILVAGTFFMEILDGTILSTAAPDIADSLGVRAADIGVAITAYLVTLAVLIPISGWLADRYGTRTVFVGAILLFSVASGLCALSTSLPELTALRVLQGAGGALMVPVGRLVVLRGTAKRDVIRAIAFLTWPGLVAPIAAPLLGGLLTTYLSWHWIFLINLPLGAAALIGAIRLVPQLREPQRLPMDWPGFLQTSGCLAALVLAMSALGAETIDVPLVIGSSAAAALLGLAAYRHLTRTTAALLDLSLFSVRTFRVAHVGGGVYRATVFAVPFVLPLMFQEAFGWSAVRAGALVMAVFFGNLAIKPATTALLRRWQFRTVISWAVMIVSLTMFLFATISPRTPIPALVVLLVISGAARSVGFTAYNTIMYADIDLPQMTSANTLSSTFQQLAGGLGVAVGALGLQIGALIGWFGNAPITPYRITFGLLAVLTLTSLVEARRMGRDAGHQLRG